jgi:DNA-binding MarR family transcriptional regulator
VLVALGTDDEDTDDGLLDEAAYVMGSQYRIFVLETLISQPSTPTQIAEQHDVALSHVSRALSELSERDMVQSHSSGSRTKLFSLTSLGERIIGVVDELDQGENE